MQTHTSEQDHSCRYCPEPIEKRTPYVYIVEPFYVAGELRRIFSKAHPECALRRKYVTTRFDY